MGRLSVLLPLSFIVLATTVSPAPVNAPAHVMVNEQQATDHSDASLSRPKRVSSNTVSLQSLSGDIDKLREDAVSRRKRDTKSLGRSKRQAVFDYDDVDALEPSVEEELASLSDEELNALASIVRNELDAYENAALSEKDGSALYDDNDIYDVESAPEQETARLVPVVVEDYANYDQSDADDEPVFGRPRRSDPDPDYAVFIPSASQVADDDSVQLLPQTAEGEANAVDDDLVDELELRSRIAELAEILNERVASGY